MVSESIIRHRPPNSSNWTSGSVNAARLVYCSGRVSARTSAAGGAHCGPASRPTSPPKLKTASAPSTGLTTAAAGHPAGPPAARQEDWHPRHELRQQPAAVRGKTGTGERQPGMCPAERGQCLRDGQRAVIGNPVPQLENRSRAAQHDDLRRIHHDLPGAKPGGHHGRPREPPPARPGPDRPGAAGGQRGHQTLARHPAQRGGQHDHGQRRGDQDQRRGPQPASQQQAQARQQPGHHEQHRHRGELGKGTPGDGHPAPRPGHRARLLTAALGYFASRTASRAHTVHCKRRRPTAAGRKQAYPMAERLRDRFILLAPHAVASRGTIGGAPPPN